MKQKFQAMHTFLVCMMFSLLSGGCDAQAGKSSSLFAPADSTVKAEMRYNIYKIITEAKKIKAEEISLTNDTTKTVKVEAIDIKSKYIPLVQFILTDPKIYHGNLATYGKFMPSFRLTFIKKKEVRILNFDFGLKKWNVCDGTGKQIKMYDLSSDDMLRFANMLFPENELYKNLINSDKR